MSSASVPTMMTASMFSLPSPASTPANPKVISDGIGMQHASRKPNKKTAANTPLLGSESSP